MSTKSKTRKLLRRTVRREGDRISRRMIEDLLASPLRERVKVAVNLVCKREVFTTK